MNITIVKNCLSTLFKSKKPMIVPFLIGSPGIGKTAIISQAADEAGLDCQIINLTTCESVDIRGLPTIKNNQTVWSSPLPKEGRGVLVLDEITSAHRDVQIAAHHIVWREKNSDVSVPEGWHIVLTGNKSSDKTIYNSLCAPLRNRVTTIECEVDSSGWLKWARDNDIDDSILGFIQWRPELLMSSKVPESGAFVSPRSWQIVNSILNLGLFKNEERDLIAGSIGDGACIEFVAYLDMVRQLPRIEEIVQNEKKAPLPSSPSTIYALISALSRWTLLNNKTVMTYVSRLSAEFGMLYLNLIRDQYNLANDDLCLEWIGKHKNLFEL